MTSIAISGQWASDISGKTAIVTGKLAKTPRKYIDSLMWVESRWGVGYWSCYGQNTCFGGGQGLRLGHRYPG